MFIMEISEQYRARLIVALYALRLVKIFEVAACTMFIWDYILTFRREVDLVWKSKWNFMKGLYFFQRYLPFIDTVWIVLYIHTERGLTQTVCAKIYPRLSVLMMAGVVPSEMLLTLRTWAAWNRNQRLSIILQVFFVLVWGSGFVMLAIYLNSVIFRDPPYPGFQGCILKQANIDIAFLWVPVIIWDTLMLILILVPGVQAYRSGGNSALTKALYRDGVVYYLWLFVLSFLNILLITTLPLQYRHLLTMMQRVFHSMLASRVLFHIRAQTGQKPVLSNVEISTNHGL